MKMIETNKMIENIRFFTIKLSEISEKCLYDICIEKKCGVGKHIGLSRGVLALSHRKQSEDFFAEKTAGLLTQKTSSSTALYALPREHFFSVQISII